MPRLLLPLLAACLALAPVALADMPSTGAQDSRFASAFRQSGNAYMEGSVESRLQLSVLDIHPSEGPLRLDVVGLHEATYVEDRFWVDPQISPPILVDDPATPQEKDLQFNGGIVAVASSDYATIRYLPRDEPYVEIMTEGPTDFRPPGNWRLPPSESALAHLRTIIGIDLHPAGSKASFSGLGNFTVDLPPGYLVFDGMDVDWGTGQSATGHWSDQDGSVSDPMTGSGRHVSQGRLLVAQVDAIRVPCVQCSFASMTDMASGTLVGTGRWHGVNGTSSLDNSTLPSDLALLETNGEYDWNVASDGTGMRWNIAGTARWVKHDTVTMGQAVAGALAIGVAVSAIALLATFKGIATWVLGRHTPRLVKAPLLDGQARHRILEAIHKGQPATLARIRAATGLSRGNLRYHLRILESHDVLQSVLPPGHARRERSFMLNSGSLMFKAAGLSFADGGATSSQDASGRILSGVNADDVRASILEFLLMRHEATYEEVREHLVGSGVVGTWPRSTGSYQLKKMVEAKAIGERREGMKKLYFAEIDPRKARAHQYQSYFIQSGNKAIADALANGPSTIEQIERQLWQRGVEVGALKERLRKLTSLAILRVDADGRYVLGAFAGDSKGNQ